MHFYILTEIYRQPSKIENFNRLPTKKLSFNRQPTSGSPYLDPLLKRFIVGFVLLLRAKLQVNFDPGQDFVFFWCENKAKVVAADRATLHPGTRIRRV